MKSDLSISLIKEFDATRILKTALKNGGSFAEIYGEHIEGLQIISEQKQIEKINPTIDFGVGIRVLSEDKTAYAFTSEVTEKSLMTLAASVAEAVQGKKFETPISLRKIPPPIQFSMKTSPASVDLAGKIKLLQRADQSAWAMDTRVRQVKVLYGEIMKEICILNSLGEMAEEKRYYTLFFTQVVAEENGILQTGYYPVGGITGLEILDESPPEMISKKAVEQALTMLQAAPSPAGTMPVILSSEAGGTMIHEAVGHGLEADLASHGLSVYHRKIGQEIADRRINVVDDATLPGKRGSFLFDDEGIPSERTLLIENGILKNYMYDRRMAMRDDTQSTGNGRRESFRHKPICRMTNTMILPGTDEPEAIIRSTERGLFVKKMGGGQVNTVNGDFVFEVSEGNLIEKGKIGPPVRGATLMGNGPRVLQTIDKIGSDQGFSIGTCGKDGQGVPVSDAQPTIRIPELVVGGVSYPPSSPHSEGQEDS